MNPLTTKQEIALLRSAVISLIGQDPEGEYRPEFVEKIFRDFRRVPTKKFVSAKQFLNDVRKA